MSTTRRTVYVVALALVLPLVAGACLVRTGDGRTLDCQRVTERYRHRGQLGRMHTHTRQVWRCSDVTPTVTSTTTTTAAPQAPTITSVVPSFDGTELLLDVTVDDPDTGYEAWQFGFKLDGDPGYTTSLTVEYVSDTTIRVHTGVDPRPSAQGSVQVTDDSGLTGTGTWSYVHCGAGVRTAGDVALAC